MLPCVTSEAYSWADPENANSGFKTGVENGLFTDPTGSSFIMMGWQMNHHWLWYLPAAACHRLLECSLIHEHPSISIVHHKGVIMEPYPVRYGERF